MLTDGHWIAVLDGDDRARALFDRHYSRYRYADGRKPRLFVGPGEKYVLLTEDCRALWVWRKFIDASGQQGVNCVVFRNEGAVLSSTLILEAEAWAWRRWPGERLYTYVHPGKLPHTLPPLVYLLLTQPSVDLAFWAFLVCFRPGACFMWAGWQACGLTKRHSLWIFEKYPPALSLEAAA